MRRRTVLLVALALYAAAATVGAILLARASHHEESRRHHVEKQLSAAQRRTRATAATLRRENNELRDKLRTEARLEAEVAAFSRRGSSGVTTLASPGGTIEWFAQSGSRIAWVRSARSNPEPGSSDICSAGAQGLRVDVRDLSAATQSAVTLADVCEYSGLAEPALAFGGTYLLAEFDDGVGNTEIDVAVEAVSVRGGKPWKATNVSELMKHDCGQPDEFDPSVNLGPCYSTTSLRRTSSDQPAPLLAAAGDSLLVANSGCEGEECESPRGSGIHEVRPQADTVSGLPKLFNASGTPQLLAVGGRTIAVAARGGITIGTAHPQASDCAHIDVGDAPRARDVRPNRGDAHESPRQ